MTRNDERVALVAFFSYSILAGGNAVGVRFSNRELAPLWGAGVRFAAAAAILLVVMAVLRLAVPRGRALTTATVYGLLNFGLSFALIYYGMVRVHAGLAQIILALVPLATALLAVAWRQERLRAAGVIGSLLALGGIALISRAPLDQSVPPLSLLAIVGAALCFAQALVLLRRSPPVNPIALNAVGLTVAAVALLGASLLAGEPHALPRQPETWAALAYLVVLGSVAVFVLYVLVLRYWVASRVAYGFVVIPFFAVLLSAWLDGEPITGALIVGGVLIIAGVYFGALRGSATEVASAGRPSR